VLAADDHVSELPRTSRGFGLIDGKGKDVSGGVDSAMVAVQPRDPGARHEDDRQVPVLDARRRQRRPRRTLDPRRGRWKRRIAGVVLYEDLDLQRAGQACFRRRSAGACFSAYWL
jgi:hypothetical protein